MDTKDPQIDPANGATLHTKRNEAFQAGREPLSQLPDLQPRHARITGPLSFRNPTTAQYHINSGATDEDSLKTADKRQNVSPGVNYKWTSRNNRKGRHAISIDPKAQAAGTANKLPRSTSSFSAIVHGIVRMFTYYPVWDVSYLVATIFTLGSVIWVFNAFFVYLPLQVPSSEFSTEILYGGGITAFIGATVFVIGSFLLMAEAINESRTGCFGWALEQLDEQLITHLHPDKSTCVHHHANKRNLVGQSTQSSDSSSHPSSDPNSASDKTWIWWPSWYDLRTHHLHSLGFLASLSQLLGASIFWIAGLTALPGIYNHMSPGLTDGIYWTPQVVGGTGFVVSGVLFMLETQRKWWLPAPGVLGWHIGLWNLIGGVGFTLSPAFGYDTHSWAEYQAALSTFWGSWAFLIGSAVQWYESLEKFPVEHSDLD